MQLAHHLPTVALDSTSSQLLNLLLSPLPIPARPSLHLTLSITCNTKNGFRFLLKEQKCIARTVNHHLAFHPLQTATTVLKTLNGQRTTELQGTHTQFSGVTVIKLLQASTPQRIHVNA
jgi:hypothetical protein